MLKCSFSTMAAVSFVPTGRETHDGPVADTVTPLLTGVGGSYRKLRAPVLSDTWARNNRHEPS